MTVIYFLLREDKPVGFELTGHSGAGRKGSDIVCAAISSAAYMTVNTITDVIGANAQTEVSDGRLKLTISPDEAEKCRVVLDGFMLHMKQLRRQRPHNIRIITVNTGKEHYYA